MESFMRADAFFFISSIGFVVLAILGAIALVYLILLLRRLLSITRKVEEDVDSIADEVKKLLAVLAESRLLGWLFRKRRPSREK